jgi:hypothetical protein
VVSNTYQVGGYVFGIRTNSEAAAAWLDEYLGSFEIEEETEPFYSLMIANGGARNVKRFHILYREAIALTRSFDPTDLGRALISELEGLLFENRDDALYAKLGAMTGMETVAVVPSEIIPYLDMLGSRVRRAGITLGDAQYVAIDPETGRLIPITPMLDVPWDAPEALRSIRSGAGNGRLSIDRSTRVDVAFSTSVVDDPVSPIGRPLTLYRLASQAVNLRKLGLSGLEGLAKLVEGSRCLELSSARASRTLAGVARGLGLE